MTTMESKEPLELQISRIKGFVSEIERTLPLIRKLTQGSAELDNLLKESLMSYGAKINFSKVNPDYMKEWQNHMYFLFQEKGMKDYEWKIAIPKFADSIHFGMLVGEQPGHRIFLVSRYIDMVYDLPEWLREKIGAKKDDLDIKLDLSTMQLKGKDVSKVQEKYAKFMKKENGKIIVDKEQYFELLAQMIEDGIKPFEDKPISKELFVDRKCDFELRDYQKSAWETIKQKSMAFVCWPPSAGKTYFTIYLHTKVKGPHLVAVPQRTLQEQWIERLQLYTDLKTNESNNEKEMQESDVTVMTYQSAIKHAHKINWTSVTVDEGHHLPANEFSKMAGINRQITIGLSATPHREDGRERYLFALYGEGIGIDWENMKKLGIIKNPDLHVWIVKNEKDRMNKLDQLLQEDQRTLIFCDEIELGKLVAKKYNIPFIFGDSKERMNTIRMSKTFVISRVGDEGISLPDVERVIEISFLKGSRRQELQRFTRLLHSKNEKVGEGHIIFDPEEYTLYHKRLFGVLDRGFKVVIHREGIADKIVSHFEKPHEIVKSRSVIKKSKPVEKKEPVEKVELDEAKYPLLKYPGIRKIVQSLSHSSRKVILFLIDPQNQNQSFRLEQIAMSLGYKNKRSLTINGLESPLPPLIQKGYVKKEGNTYKQNFSDMVKQ
ncbi:MAG: DEAD/DEAH box helicase family protein [Nitrososphaera sp.]